MITEHIQPILVVTGVMTFTATIGFFLFPRNLLRRVFGIEEIGLALILATMSSGLTGSLVGALLIYAAFDYRLRVSAIAVAIIEKIIFAGVVFLGPLKKFGIAKWAAVGDSFMALLYVGYLSGF
jgi:hypothetical protein